MTKHEPDNKRDLVLGTAGHIDHGKSALVLALTGIDPDRLAEEKRRGITIELGFAQLHLDSGLSLGVVDVPGHERFVRQMIAGSSGIDIALLCIAADDGVMPQTVEHLAVLELLGIERCLVALTKVDLVDDEWLAAITAEVADFLSQTAYAGAEIIPVSSLSGQGLEELKAALDKLAGEARQPLDTEAVRLPIDRVFTIKGHGTVVSGTLWSGAIKADDRLELLPQQREVRVRTVQIHGLQTEVASAGHRVALNLSGLETEELTPGDFLVSPGTLSPTDRFDASLSYLGYGQASKALKSGQQVHIAHGTREVIGRVLLLSEVAAGAAASELKAHATALVQIRLEKELPLSLHDRFVIRTGTPLRVTGGGVVLRAHPRRRSVLSNLEARLLEALRSGDDTAAVTAALELHDFPISCAELAEFTGLSVSVCSDILEGLVKKRQLLCLEDEWFVTLAHMQKSLSQLEKLLLDFHRARPQEAGVTKNALRQSFSKSIDARVFAVLLSQALHKGSIIQLDGLLAHATFLDSIKGAGQQASEALMALLKSAGASPLPVAELAQQSGFDASLARRALVELEKQGKVVRISSELYFESSIIAGYERAIRAYLGEAVSATAAELRDAMQTTRKYAIPLLEYFDAERLTVRQGDTRSLR